LAAVEAQPVPQSSAKSPTPRIPLKPAAAAPVAGVVQPAGRWPKVESITWMGTWTAGSPPRTTSAVATGPQCELPSRYSTHSASVPAPAAARGSENGRTSLKSLSP
jgi:hypothetical protein